MPLVTDTDRVQAEIEIRNNLVDRIAGTTGVANVYGRERRPDEDTEVEDTVTVPDPITAQPIVRTVFVEWMRSNDRQDVQDATNTTLILSYRIAVIDEFIDVRADGTNSKDEHKVRVLRIQSELKSDRHLGFDSSQVNHLFARMPFETQIVEDTQGSAHLSLLTLDVEITGFKA